MTSSAPLQLIYFDVWGPSPVASHDGFSYSIILVDHFTKYTWLFTIKFKYEVLDVLTKFKYVAEIFFQ